jgi:hypothetical protein
MNYSIKKGWDQELKQINYIIVIYLQDYVSNFDLLSFGHVCL